MLHLNMKTLFCTAFILLFSLPVFAWDETGHKITGYIAWQRMTPATRDRVFKILSSAAEDSDIATFYLGYGSRSEEARRREYFMLLATWADIVRDKNIEARYAKYHKSNWHYADTFWSWKDGKSVMEDTHEEGGLGMKKLTEFIETIKSSASDEDKALAIAWIEHLIGDLHQPLHTSAKVTPSNPKGDQGGNLFLLTPKGTPRAQQQNLHWFWDSIIGRNIPNNKDLCDADYIDPIANKIMRQYPADKFRDRLKINAPEEWRQESLNVAMTEVYKDIEFFEPPSDKYKKKAFKIAEERLALAGYRMGEVFNQVFGAVPPAK